MARGLSCRSVDTILNNTPMHATLNNTPMHSMRFKVESGRRISKFEGQVFDHEEENNSSNE